ncbi:hypothetical protein ACD904_20820, partial [Escherichia coli]
DGNGSHWSTSKTPSYTKSVSWQHHRKLPRTEYTGETNYAEKIALASNGLFSADAILTIGRNKTTTKKLMGVDS